MVNLWKPYGPAILKYEFLKSLTMQNYLKEEIGLEQLGYIIWDYFFHQTEVIHIHDHWGNPCFYTGKKSRYLWFKHLKTVFKSPVVMVDTFKLNSTQTGL